ncbi:60S ribosomal protein L31 [Podila humilis]|nr:60S ribosomal protein L31 [Podila humilis]
MSNRARRKRAPRAIKAVKFFAAYKMGTRLVKLDPSVNKCIWKKQVPIERQLRLRLTRRLCTTTGRHNGEWYTYVVHVPVESFTGLQDTVVIEEDGVDDHRPQSVQVDDTPDSDANVVADETVGPSDQA